MRMGKRLASAGAVLVIAASTPGCTSGPMPLTEPKYGLRKDIFQNVPVWETNLFDPPTSVAGSPTKDQRDTVTAQSKISRYTSPGLYVLLRQVDPNHPLLATSDDDQKIVARLDSQSKQSPNVLLGDRRSGQAFDVQSYKTRADRFIQDNDSPLPPDLAQEPVLKAYIASLAFAYYSGQLRAFARDSNTQPPPPTPLPEVNFTVQDFRALGEKFMRSNLDMIQAPRSSGGAGGPAADQPPTNEDIRWKRIRLMIPPAGGGPRRADTPPSQITWNGIAFQYFTAYYKGDFVDRTGGKLSKPDLGKKISNETITSALSVGLESIYDFAVLSASKGPHDRAIKAPVVFTGGAGSEKWQGGNEPTLVVVTQKLLKKKHADPIEVWPYVVEKVAKDNEIGISSAKRKLIQWASGLAGDGAGSLTDFITRTFGGIHIGFGILGKVSVGDNDTLAKMISTTIESFAHRGSELFMSHVVYDSKFDDPPKPDFSNDSPGVLLLKYIALFDGDYGD